MDNDIENNNILELLMCRLNDIKDADTFQLKINFFVLYIHVHTIMHVKSQKIKNLRIMKNISRYYYVHYASIDTI